MRIDRLDLMAYGGFTDKSLDLSGGTAGLHLIYGDNEAGKSTSLRAIIAWLFGIPARTTDNYLHANTQLRIGGKLRLADGESLEFVRRKGTKGTLLAAAGNETLDDAVLLPFLPDSMDEDLFSRLYGIDHERLLAGGKALLDQSGDLGQALFSAALGVASPRAVLSGLQEEAEALFKPRASTKRVNKAITQFKDARKRVKEASLPVAEWSRLQSALQAVTAQLNDVETEISEKARQKSHLDRLKRIQGPLAERRIALERMQALQAILVLPEDFDEQCQTAFNRLHIASEAHEKALARRIGLQQEAESLNVRSELLDNEAAILELYKDLGAVEKTIRDRPQQDGQRRLLRNEALDLLKAVRADLGIDEADKTLRPLMKKKNWVAELAKQQGLLAQKREAAERSLQEADDKQRSVKQQLDELPATIADLQALKNAVAVARKSGDLEERLAKARQQATQSQTACDHEFQRLGRFSGSLDALLKLALPLMATLDEFEQILQDDKEASRDCTRKQQELLDEHEKAEQALTALLSNSDAPPLARLHELRTERDQAWQLIKQHYIEQRPVQKIPPIDDSSLPQHYEQHITATDHIADRLRLEADQVAKRAALEATLTNLNTRISKLAETKTQLINIQQDHQHSWEAVWQPLGIQAGTPREMKQWLINVDKLLDKLQLAAESRHSAEHLAQDYKAQQKAVSVQLAQFAAASDSQNMALEAMLSACEQRITQEEALLDQQRQLTRTLEDISSGMHRLRENLKNVTNEQAAWDREWMQAIAGLDLTADAHPQYVTDTFEQLVNFFATFDKSEEKRRRIYGIDKVQEDFDQKVSEFIASIGVKQDNQAASALVIRLHQDLNQAREARARLNKIKEADKSEAETLLEAEITIKAANTQLTALKAQANVNEDSELLEAAENSRHKRALQNQLDTLEQELSRSGDGLSIAQLEAEAIAADTDVLEAEAGQVAAELKALYDQRDALRDQRQTVQNDLDAKDGSAVAAEAAEEMEQHRTEIKTGVEQYLRLKIAAHLLEQRIEDYRRKNQTPVLSRAGEIFARLTLQAYGGLRDELGNDGKPVLLGIRPDNTEVLVDRMSEGTRAQLYLALRLATLEQHLQHGEPMPFVVDDILISFDDRRTEAGLEVLAEVAARTQVLLFTHHRRVIDLAAEIATPAGVYRHELTN